MSSESLSHLILGEIYRACGWLDLMKIESTIMVNRLVWIILRLHRKHVKILCDMTEFLGG